MYIAEDESLSLTIYADALLSMPTFEDQKLTLDSSCQRRAGRDVSIAATVASLVYR